MVEEIDATGTRCHYGGIAQRRYLIAEVCARYYGTRHPSGMETHDGAYAHECHAYGGDGAPGTSGEYRYDSADSACGDKEEGGIEHSQAIVDECGNDAAEHPCGRHHGDEHEHGHGGKNLACATTKTDDKAATAQ